MRAAVDTHAALIRSETLAGELVVTEAGEA